ncbi:MAG TPA: exodeoxyribonuclease III, partial [Casimicrobiaceae bacterium]
MKIATWNINSLAVRLPRLLAWLPAAQPDIVCLQETKLEDAKFPRLELAAAGYTAIISGQRTYNGVALLVRDDFSPPTDIASALPGLVDEQKRVVAATVAGLRIVCFYVPNGQSVDSDKYRYKLEWCRSAAAWLKDELARHP